MSNIHDLEVRVEALYQDATETTRPLIDENLCKECLVVSTCTIGCPSFDAVYGRMWKWLVDIADLNVSKKRIEEKFWTILKEFKEEDDSNHEEN